MSVNYHIEQTNEGMVVVEEAASGPDGLHRLCATPAGRGQAVAPALRDAGLPVLPDTGEF